MSPGSGSPGSACESPRPQMYVDDDVDVDDFDVDDVDDYDVDVDVDDVDDVDVVDDDADDDDDVDEMRKKKSVIRLPKRMTRGISQNIGSAQSKRTFPGSTPVLAVIIVYIYIHLHMYILLYIYVYIYIHIHIYTTHETLFVIFNDIYI